MKKTSISDNFNDLRRKLNALPEAEEPPPTTLQVLGRSHKENDWQQILVHFLNADRAHGFNHAILEHLLESLSRTENLDYSFSRFDLERVQIEQEVYTDDGYPDAVLWSPDDWFMCFEMKINSSETNDQTERYVNVDSFSGINLEKSDIPEEDHHYIYLAPEGSPPPSSDEFVTVSWEWLSSELQSFLAKSYGEYPSRSTAQLKEFIDTIRSELIMTDYQKNQRDKAELYVQYHEDIQEVEEAFDEELNRFSGEWGDRLAGIMDDGEMKDADNIPDNFTSYNLSRGEHWIFRQNDDWGTDWAYLFKNGWWKNIERWENIYNRDRPDIRIGFLHRPKTDNEIAVGDRQLIFYFRLPKGNDDTFKDVFEEEFYEREDEIEKLLPESSEITGDKLNMIRATYDIKVDSHGNFFDAYTAALRDGFVEHVVANHALVEILDEIHSDSLERLD